MRVNFFVMFPRATWATLPVSYISAFRAPRRRRASTTGWRATFPTSRTSTCSATIAQMQGVLDQVDPRGRVAVRLHAGGGAGGAVGHGLGHARGARARVRGDARGGRAAALLGAVQRAELLGVGALAGLLASSRRWRSAGRWRAACSSSAGTRRRGCRSRARASGALLALAAGWWGLHEVLRRPVMETLRRAAEV